MRDRSWLTRLIACERGNALLSLATLPLLLSSAALSHDVVQLGIWTRQLQQAADAGAAAGARAVAAGEAPDAAAGRAAGGDARLHIVAPPAIRVTRGAGGGQIVRVALASQRPLPFLGAMMERPPTRVAEGSAIVRVSAVTP